TRFSRDWSSDVCSSDLKAGHAAGVRVAYIGKKGGHLAPVQLDADVLAKDGRRQNRGGKHHGVQAMAPKVIRIDGLQLPTLPARLVVFSFCDGSVTELLGDDICDVPAADSGVNVAQRQCQAFLIEIRRQI